MIRATLLAGLLALSFTAQADQAMLSCDATKGVSVSAKEMTGGGLGMLSIAVSDAHIQVDGGAWKDRARVVNKLGGIRTYVSVGADHMRLYTLLPGQFMLSWQSWSKGYVHAFTGPCE